MSFVKAHFRTSKENMIPQQLNISRALENFIVCNVSVWSRCLCIFFHEFHKLIKHHISVLYFYVSIPCKSLFNKSWKLHRLIELNNAMMRFRIIMESRTIIIWESVEYYSILSRSGRIKIELKKFLCKCMHRNVEFVFTSSGAISNAAESS